MSVPTTYTESTLKAFMVGRIGQYAGLLSLAADDDSLDDAVIATMLALGLTDLATVSTASGVVALRAVARREAWRAALEKCADLYDYSDPTGSNSQQQIYEHCLQQWQLCAGEAARYDPSDGSATIDIDYVDAFQDPYQYRTDAERAEYSNR